MLRTGVYQDWHRHSAIVVRIKDGNVSYLTMNETALERVGGQMAYTSVNERVAFCTMKEAAFTKQFDIYLPDYPVLRAVRVYWRSGLSVTPEAERVIKLLLVNLKTKREKA
jgi:hypothetical protein